MKKFMPLNFDHIVYIGRVWFNQCGVVLVFDTEIKEYKSYISGEIGLKNELKDILKISSYGSTFPIVAAKALFPGIDFTEDITKTNAEYFV